MEKRKYCSCIRDDVGTEAIEASGFVTKYPFSEHLYTCKEMLWFVFERKDKFVRAVAAINAANHSKCSKCTSFGGRLLGIGNTEKCVILNEPNMPIDIDNFWFSEEEKTEYRETHPLLYLNENILGDGFSKV